MGRCLDWEACSDRHERSGPKWALKRPMVLQVSVFTARGRPRPPRLFLHPCPFILNDCVQPFSFASLPLPPSHFPSFSFFPLILFFHPQCACYLGCVPYRPLGLWARGPGRGAAGTMRARGGDV
ncbi:hypothetical protein QQF64_030020 [Cirrhinus molitorella]|uniref:Uncharacterized protein n=1 Tax=Cirrhinus molitorella TaxID=172907 RepID=A0ABR3N283_9TELE